MFYDLEKPIEFMKDVYKALSDDGIWICDLKRNKKELIIDLESVVNFKFDSHTLDTEHYINHLSFNPSGNRFLFFHVYNNNGERRTRAITSDVNGNNLFLLNYF